MQNRSHPPHRPEPKIFLSKKDIPPRERLIVALDVDGPAEARALVEKLGDSVVFYKLGLQMFMAGGYFEFVDELKRAGKKVFVDLKFFDVPETVALAIRGLARHEVEFATVHGNDEMLRRACENRGDLKILAVTVLTSLDRSDLEALGFKCTVEDLVLSRARNALEIGCSGVISSGLEAEKLRAELGDRFLIVTPGIRPVDNKKEDDQKRTVSVEAAFKGGADYVVVGRPIKNAPDSRAAAERIQKTISELFGR